MFLTLNPNPILIERKKKRNWDLDVRTSFGRVAE